MRRVTATFLPIESRPFVTIDVDLVDGGAPDDFTSWRSGVTDAVVRLRYRATEEQARRLDHHRLRDDLLEAGAHKVYAIQSTIIKPERVRDTKVDEDLAPLAAVDAWLDAHTDQIPEPHPAGLRELASTYLQEA